MDPSHLLSRSPAFDVVGAPRLHVCASRATLQRIAQLLQRDCAPDSFPDPEVGERLNLELHQIEALRPFTAGLYRVTAFPANHDPAVEPLLYAIQADECSIFYGTSLQLFEPISVLLGEGLTIKLQHGSHQLEGDMIREILRALGTLVGMIF